MAAPTWHRIDTESGTITIGDRTLHYDVYAHRDQDSTLVMFIPTIGADQQASFIKDDINFFTGLENVKVFLLWWSSTKGINAQDTVNDIKQLTGLPKYEKLKWHLFSGGWGATLALLYAQQNCHTVASLVLCGIFTGSPSEINDVFGANGRAAEASPEKW